MRVITIFRNGSFEQVRALKPEAPRTLRKWHERWRSAAISRRQTHYIVRHSNKWHVMSVDPDEGTLRSFADKEAAEMWLMHRHART